MCFCAGRHDVVDLIYGEARRSTPGHLKSAYFTDDSSRRNPREQLSALGQYLISRTRSLRAIPYIPRGAALYAQ